MGDYLSGNLRETWDRINPPIPKQEAHCCCRENIQLLVLWCGQSFITSFLKVEGSSLPGGFGVKGIVQTYLVCTMKTNQP